MSRSPSYATSADWSPEQYNRFAGPRLRPALDLLSQIRSPDARTVYDLGCGTGEITRILAQRFEKAQITGIDHSPQMLESAREEPSRISWVKSDVATWEPAEAADIVYSNAALQWLGGHEVLFPRLLSTLRPGGVLAVQMPLSWGMPSHRLMRELLASGGEGGAPLGPVSLRQRLDEPWVHPDHDHYWRLLAPLCEEIDIWRTEYLHPLQGQDPVLEWVKGTGLRPILEGLEPIELERFLDAYRVRLRELYPPLEDSTTIYPFSRLFLVCRRA